MKTSVSGGSRVLLFALCLILIAAFFLPGFASADEKVTVDNGLPVVYLNIDESCGTIEDMTHSGDHSVYCYGKLSVVVPEGFHYSDFPDLACVSFEDLDMSIRGRGNSTWREPKKPFKIKLDKKADLFGLGKNKHWVLVANAMDETLLRDRITAWLGDEMGFSFTPRGVPVDVVMTGERFGTQYLGSYYFSENVRVDDNRLEIADLAEDDVDPSVITGGYLIQNGVQVRRGSPDIFFTDRGANWATNTPSFDTEEVGGPLRGAEDGEDAFAGTELGDAYKNNAQQDYIRSTVQHFEDMLFEEGTAYRDLMDVENAAKYWLVNQISRNSDGFATGSTYLYKDRDGADGVSKFFWGPLWDFDFAWDHSVYTQGFEYGHLWSKPMLYDTGEGGFVQEVHKQWPAMRNALERLIADGGVIDQYCAETKASAEQDHVVNHPEQKDFDYLREVQELKDWIRSRIDWVDAHLSEVGTLIHKVTLMADGEVWRTDFRSENEPFTGREARPEPADRTFVAWLDEDGNPIDGEVKITEDRVFTAQFVSDSEITHGTDIAFVKNSDVIHYNSFFPVAYQIQYEVLPTDADNRAVTWTSSDPDLAAVDEFGRVTYNGTGEVTLTAKLKYGEPKTFTLQIVAGDPPYAQSIRPEQDVIRMTVGEQSGCPILTEPTPAKISGYTYETNTPDIVAIGELGVLTAVAPGEAKVRIAVDSYDENNEPVTLETEVTVIVSEPAPEPTPDPSPSPSPSPAGITYTVTPDSAVWTKGSAKPFTFTVKRSEADETCFSHFTGVKLDGKLLEKDKDYTAASGSTVVTFKASALQKQTIGKHTVTVLFDDGEAEAALEIQAAGRAANGGTSSRSAKTGDARSVVVWTVLLGAGLCGAAWSATRLKKER